mgnify:CR=1 FL=1
MSERYRIVRRPFFSRGRVTCFFALLILLLVYRHYGYVYSLSPMVREIYNNIGRLPHTGTWTEDASAIAAKYIPLGISVEQGRKALTDAGLEFGKNMHRNPDEIEAYDTNIYGYIHLRACFAGSCGLLFGYYGLIVTLDFNNDKLEKVGAYVHTHGL